MNYKQFLNHLAEDYSAYHLKQILKGEIGFNPNLKTKLTLTQRKYLFEKYIPKTIIRLEKDIQKEIPLWRKSPIFRLAFVRCQQKRQSVEYLFDEAMDIINHLNCDNQNKALQLRFKEYYRHTKNGDYGNAEL